MLTLPRFEIALPKSVEEAVTELQAPLARVLSGGTDLLPNLKHRIESPAKLVSLQRLAVLRDVVDAGDSLRIGGMCTLTSVATSALVSSHFPSLATAARSVASAQIRNVGTLGGNINLDTRCRYVNQTEFWRGALGGCLKAKTCDASDVCHVVPKGKRCVAAMSSDTVPVLVSLGATIVLQGPEGERELAIADYFRADGLSHTVRAQGEILTHVVLPKPVGPRRSAYIKWRPRQSIDFPLVSVALNFEGVDTITAATAVIGVLGATPRVVALDRFVGRAFGDAGLSEELAEVVFSRAKPLPNVPYDPAYRRRLVRVLTRRAIESLV